MLARLVKGLCYFEHTYSDSNIWPARDIWHFPAQAVSLCFLSMEFYCQGEQCRNEHCLDHVAHMRISMVRQG